MYCCRVGEKVAQLTVTTQRPYRVVRHTFGYKQRCCFLHRLLYSTDSNRRELHLPTKAARVAVVAAWPGIKLVTCHPCQALFRYSSSSLCCGPTPNERCPRIAIERVPPVPPVLFVTCTASSRKSGDVAAASPTSHHSKAQKGKNIPAGFYSYSLCLNHWRALDYCSWII